MPANQRYPNPFGMPGESLADDVGEGTKKIVPGYDQTLAFKHASDVIRAMAENVRACMDSLDADPNDRKILSELAGIIPTCSYWDLHAVANGLWHQHFRTIGITVDDRRGALVVCADLPTPVDAILFTIPLFGHHSFLSTVMLVSAGSGLAEIPRFVPVGGQGKHRERLTGELKGIGKRRETA